ncbi:hypothetical protein BVRB_8g188760 [Beta vulgaris subsp. vulgaris]|nr:hypothetical protein BVRB_8g188760 [Beta vulgaris subsp. vulgaris]
MFFTYFRSGLTVFQWAPSSFQVGSANPKVDFESTTLLSGEPHFPSSTYRSRENLQCDSSFSSSAEVRSLIGPITDTIPPSLTYTSRKGASRELNMEGTIEE